MTEIVNKVYRYDARQYAPPLNEFEVPMGEGTLAVELSSFPVIGTTPCGVWIEHPTKYTWDANDNMKIGKRFINLRAKKQFACVTIEEAQASFLARKERQALILSSQLKNVKKAISIMKKLTNPKEPSDEFDIA